MVEVWAPVLAAAVPVLAAVVPVLAAVVPVLAAVVWAREPEPLSRHAWSVK